MAIQPAAEEALDFGDADDSPFASIYPTLLANNGARHVIVPGVFLGAAIDAEADGQPDGTATGDDKQSAGRARRRVDGVGLPSVLVAGAQPCPCRVVASVPGFLNAWIDWNGNGTWSDPGEQVFVNYPLAPGPIRCAVRAAAAGVRFRRSAIPAGASRPIRRRRPRTPGGIRWSEMEDYEVRLQVLDFGDAPDPAYPTCSPTTAARHLIPAAPRYYYLGARRPISIPTGQPTAAVDGDDASGRGRRGRRCGRSLRRAAGGGRRQRGAGRELLHGRRLSERLAGLRRQRELADAGEQIAADRAMPAGFSALVFGIPAQAWDGTVSAGSVSPA